MSLTAQAFVLMPFAFALHMRLVDRREMLDRLVSIVIDDTVLCLRSQPFMLVTEGVAEARERQADREESGRKSRESSRAVTALASLHEHR